MFPTTEIRWFFPGRIDDVARAWLGALAPLDAPAVRTDHYLRLPGRDDLGIKLREGRLEIKQREGSPTVVAFNDAVGGNVENYRKWAFLPGDAGAELAALTGTADWLAVRKERWLGEVAADCNLELTAVECGGHKVWTVAFEAWGGASAALLRRAVDHAIAAAPPPPLPATASMGYAAWLARL